MASATGADAIACPSPLRPDVLEAVLFPTRGVAFLACEPKNAPECQDLHWVHLDSIPDRTLLRTQRRIVLENRKLKAVLLDRACGHLETAKTLHDELETHYRPHLDIRGLNGYTKDVILELFG